MAWYPKAVKKEIRPGGNDPAIRVVGAILHVDAGNSSSLFSYFNGPSGGIESHFHIRRDGTVEQYRDTGREADANYKANSFIDGGTRKGYVSIETQGFEMGEWTPEQITAIKKLLAWLSETHDFPLRKCRNSKDPGVGYHTLFGAPGPWTPVSKSCPGPARKQQFDRVLVSWFDANDVPPVPKPDPKPRPKPAPEVWVSLHSVQTAAKRDPSAKAGVSSARKQVEPVEDALVAEGLLDRKYADGHFGTKTIEAFAAWERRCGYKADGMPGRAALTKLGKKHGFNVKD